ncbi:MAG TPA: hypothetical protein VMX16_02105 [Terriglobia bacterium]|nr:hypothetical protein [Terriglobia bacterium]
MNLWQKFKAALNNKTFAELSHAMACYSVAVSPLIFWRSEWHWAVMPLVTVPVVLTSKLWPPTDRTVQFGHACGGYAITVTPLFWGADWKHLLAGLGLVALWTFPKEYVFDVLVEKASYADGWADQSRYLIGAGIAAMLAFALVIR